jgi:hypothetical protein
MSWQTLAAINGLLNPNLIMPGQVIRITGAAAPATAPATDGDGDHDADASDATPVHHSTYTPPRAVASTGGGAFTGIWACIARYESGGNPATDTGNGFYGGLQFTLGTWYANGGSGNPANASAAEQQAIANNVVANSGGSYGAWPNTSRMCGV